MVDALGSFYCSFARNAKLRVNDRTDLSSHALVNATGHDGALSVEWRLDLGKGKARLLLSHNARNALTKR